MSSQIQPGDSRDEQARPELAPFKLNAGQIPGCEKASDGVFEPPLSVVWKRPMRKFTVTDETGLDAIHQGADLTLEHVIRFTLGDPDKEEINLGGSYDQVVFEEGQARAIVRRRDNQKPEIVRLD